MPRVLSTQRELKKLQGKTGITILFVTHDIEEAIFLQITSRFTIAIHLLACIEVFQGQFPVNSAIFARSIGANRVIVRGVMSELNKAGIIEAGKGKKDVTLKKPLEEVTLYDIYRAVDDTAEKGLFHFHENPCPACPVGGNIHAALDGKLANVQEAMEKEMKNIPVSSVIERIREEIERKAV